MACLNKGNPLYEGHWQTMGSSRSECHAKDYWQAWPNGLSVVIKVEIT